MVNGLRNYHDAHSEPWSLTTQTRKCVMLEDYKTSQEGFRNRRTWSHSLTRLLLLRSNRLFKKRISASVKFPFLIWRSSQSTMNNCRERSLSLYWVHDCFILKFTSKDRIPSRSVAVWSTCAAAARRCRLTHQAWSRGCISRLRRWVRPAWT